MAKVKDKKHKIKFVIRLPEKRPEGMIVFKDGCYVLIPNSTLPNRSTADYNQVLPYRD